MDINKNNLEAVNDPFGIYVNGDTKIKLGSGITCNTQHIHFLGTPSGFRVQLTSYFHSHNRQPQELTLVMRPDHPPGPYSIESSSIIDEISFLETSSEAGSQASVRHFFQQGMVVWNVTKKTQNILRAVLEIYALSLDRGYGQIPLRGRVKMDIAIIEPPPQLA